MNRWLIASLCAGCTPAPDIVAALPDQAVEISPDAGPIASDAAMMKDTSALAPRCNPLALSLLLAEKAGTLSRLPGDTLQPDPLGTPDCLRYGVLAAALEQDGTIWASAADRSLWRVAQDAPSCSAIALGGSVSAMAFVYDPSSSRELLYVVDTDTLLEIDPQTLSKAKLGPLSARYLVGTDYGALFAVSEATDGVYTFDAVDLNNAQLKNMWRITSKAPLTGAAFWRGSLTLLTEADLVVYDPDTDSLKQLTAFPVSYTGLLASECATSAK